MGSRAWLLGRPYSLHFNCNIRPLCVFFLTLSFSLLMAACGGGAPGAELVANVTAGPAPLSVSFSNNSKNADEFRWDFGDGTSLTTSTMEQAVTHEYTKAGSHTVTLTAIKREEPPQTSSATITITVDPGPLHHVTVELSGPTLEVAEQQQFNAEALDQFDNPIPGLTFSFKADEQVGKIDREGKFVAGSKAGTYESAVTVEVSQGPITKTATADAVTVPGPLNRVVMQPPKATLEVTQQQQFTATGLDKFDNSLPGLSYVFRSDDRAGQVDNEGKFTAGTRVGTYQKAVTVEVARGAATQTATALVTIEPGPLHRVKIEPGETSVGVNSEQKFAASAFDQFDNPISTVDYIFRSDDRAGRVDTQGNFTAGTKAGTYESGVTVEVAQGPVTISATARVSVVPGPLHRVNIEPAKPDIEVTKAQRFTARALDRYGNPIADLDNTYQSDGLAGRVDSQGSFTAGTRAGDYQGAVTVKVSQGAVTKSALAEVMIEPGPLHRVEIEPVEPNIEVTKGRQFTFTAFDRFDNPILGLPFTFRSGEQVGQIDNLGKFTAGTRAGTYDGAVTAEVREGTKTVTAVTAVTIRHGPLEQVLLSPRTATLGIGESQKFSVQTVDAYGNPIPNTRLTWDAAQAVGVLTDDGILTAGTLADTFDQGVKVTVVRGSISTGATASVTVNPGPLNTVSIPSVVEVAAGITEQLEAIATDQYGNRLDHAEVTWTMTNSDAGSITPSGNLTAGAVVGSFQSVTQARAKQGDLITIAVSSVTVIPGPLEQVVIAPNPAIIGMGMTQQFVAVGADRFGNRVSGLDLTWSVQGGGGAMDSNGLYIAGTDPGIYVKTVKAVATQNGVTRSASASVTVEPDRIVFCRTGRMTSSTFTS